MARQASLASLNARALGRKIDWANERRGGSAPRPSAPPTRVKTCLCSSPELCTHVQRPEAGEARSPLAVIRNTGFERNPDRYDPVTHLKLPTAYAALCPRCGMFNCVCGRVAEVEALLARKAAGNTPSA